MRQRLFTFALLIGTTVALIGPLAESRAAGLPPAIVDCSSKGQLTRHYSVAELRHALAVLPADIKEYSSCYDVLNQALLADLGKLHGSGSGSGSGGSFLPTPVLVVLIVLLLAAATLGALALRRRRAPGTDLDTTDQ